MKLVQQTALELHSMAPEAERSMLNDLFIIGSGKSVKVEGFDMDVMWIYLLVVLSLIGVVVGVVLCCCGGDKGEEKKEGEEEEGAGDEEGGEEAAGVWASKAVFDPTDLSFRQEPHPIPPRAEVQPIARLLEFVRA